MVGWSTNGIVESVLPPLATRLVTPRACEAGWGGGRERRGRCEGGKEGAGRTVSVVICTGPRCRPGNPCARSWPVRSGERGNVSAGRQEGSGREARRTAGRVVAEDAAEPVELPGRQRAVYSQGSEWIEDSAQEPGVVVAVLRGDLCRCTRVEEADLFERDALVLEELEDALCLCAERVGVCAAGDELLGCVEGGV